MEVTRFVILGVATGAVFALLAQGLVLIYRGSGVLNFSQGAMAMLGAYAYYDLTTHENWPKAAAAVAALLLCGVAGALIQLLVLRHMRNSSALARVIVTLGFVLVLQSAAYLRYGHDTLAVPSLLPTQPTQLFSSSLVIPRDRIYIVAICVVLSAVLYAVYRYTAFGRITTAVAENELAAATLGYSPNLIAATNWVIGSVLAGLAGVLIAPITFLEPTGLVLLVIPAMSAALIGNFTSFGITFAAAIGLGIAQSELTQYVNQPGWGTAAPFIAIIVLQVIRGRSLPLRSFVLDRLPTVGSGRIRWPVVVVLGGLLCWLTLDFANANWATAITTTASMTIVCLSVVVLTGYAGQLSLAQYILAGVGALVAAQLAAHLPFLLALVLGAVITGLMGAIVGMPALRTRGITLAVVTLGLGGAVASVVLDNNAYDGGAGGFTVPSPSAFGWDIDPLFEANRYALVTVIVMLIISVAVANLRRGVTGRLLLATRSNERAAAALGVNVAWVKTYAFMIAATIAATGGVLIAFQQPAIYLTGFDVFTCILIVAATVTAGVGSIPGAYLGALIIGGGVASQVFSGLSDFNDYLSLVGGVTLVATLATSPDGLVEMNRRMAARLLGALAGRLPGRPGSRANTHVMLSEPGIPIRVDPRSLTVTGISVAFGGVRAVRDVSVTVQPGEVHGLIGPNGAGKTTLIDAITGFVRSTEGDIRLGDVPVGRWSPHRRAAHGLSRSFQSLELFTDLTIAENLAVAGESSAWHNYLTDFAAPGRIRLGPAASQALRGFELEELVSTRPRDISFGQRKTVAIARAIASSPSVLLLDEPAAGLDDHEAAELAALIRRIADEWGIAILLVEHKVDMIMSICDQVTVMCNGAVLAAGTPDEIRRDPAVLDAYLGGTSEADAAEATA